MKILIITGSPHRKGTSALMVEKFIEGAESAGHQIVQFQAAFKNVKPCMACNYCRNNDGQCVQKDDMEELKPQILSADMIVFATPLYYFGMTAQIKKVIDRFFAFNTELRSTPKKAALLATCGDKDTWAMDALVSHYETVCRYLKWEDTGKVLAFGVYERGDIEKSEYLEMAKAFGGRVD